MPRRLTLLLTVLLVPACFGGEGSAPEPGGEGAPAADPLSSAPAPAAAPGAGPSFSPVTGVPQPPSLGEAASRTTTVQLEEGEVQVLEQYYRTGRVRLRRQVRRTEDGIVNHGTFQRFYKNGVVAVQAEYRDGLADGSWVERFDTGQIKLEQQYTDGLRQGPKREWSDVGFVKKEAEFVDDQLHGPYRTYLMRFEGLREPHILGQYERDRKTGVWTFHYATGEKRDEGEFVDGMREGLWTTWHEDGALSLEANYQRDEWHGAVVEYDEEGRRVSDGTYDVGELVGVFTQWYPSGGKRFERTYARGKPNGPAVSWFENGQLEGRGELVDGKKTGRWEHWRTDGSTNDDLSGTYVEGERTGS